MPKFFPELLNVRSAAAASPATNCPSAKSTIASARSSRLRSVDANAVRNSCSAFSWLSLILCSSPICCWITPARDTPCPTWRGAGEFAVQASVSSRAQRGEVVCGKRQPALSLFELAFGHQLILRQLAMRLCDAQQGEHSAVCVFDFLEQRKRSIAVSLACR